MYTPLIAWHTKLIVYANRIVMPTNNEEEARMRKREEEGKKGRKL
jgi:hypothetical protein